MENDRKTQLARFKALLVTGVVTVAALVAMIGVYQNINEQEPGKEQLVQEEQAPPVEVVTNQTKDTEFEDYEDVPQENVQVMSGENIVAEPEPEPVEVIAKAPQPQEALSFDAKSKIQWPVEGNVLMNYSMDKTVYFATLDQYKYNPAIIIQGEVNAKVKTGVKGTIKEIETNETTGTTVTLDLGNGYQAIYGQLKEVKKKEGDTLEAEDVLGYIAEPTKYYSVEGSNLYFAMTKDEKPINPMDFLK